MIKSLLMGGSLALTPLVSAMAADLTFTVTNEQISESTYVADMLVQHASGTIELLPFMVTATGQYHMTISTPGSLYTPPGHASFRFWGDGAGSGNTYQPPGGGGSPPGGQMINGFGKGNPEDGQIQVLPAIPVGQWLFYLSASCIANRAAAVSIAEFHCRNAGGVHSASYGFCGTTHSVTCQDEISPSQPTPPFSGGGGGIGYQRLTFTGFSSSVPTGVVTVGDVVNEE